MLGLAPNAAALRKVKVRSAESDVLHVRQRFERALSGVEWMPPGLPSRAILLVRHLAPAQRKGAMAHSSFAELVSIAMREQAGRARRPWLHADAAGAPAVLFTDEAELIACLVRDWLHGLVAQHWWWRSVLLDASPHAWLRGEVLPRAETLVPVIALLAARGEAVAFIARLEPADCAHALAAVIRSHAVQQLATPRTSVLAPSDTTDKVATRALIAERAARGGALRRLLQEVPEVRQASLVIAQRQLLALTLALTRVPTWARTQAAAIALAALVDTAPAEFVGVPRHAEETVTDPVVAAGSDAQAVPGAINEAGVIEPAAEKDSRARVPIVVASHHDYVHAIESPRVIEARLDAIAPSQALSDRGGYKSSALMDSSASTDAEGPRPLVIEQVVTVADLPIEVEQAPREKPVSYPVDPAPRIHTQFGGLFYLLNVALALELYGDFTAPRTRNLALSPWDWLAMVGRAWFGDEIVADPLWTALAELAGRELDQEPGCDFQPPDEDWFAGHLAQMQERIALAIDCAEGNDLPALVCRYAATIEITAGTVHVHLGLCGLPLSIRIAGLDRDPGWIPAAGRDVRFHFT